MIVPCIDLMDGKAVQLVQGERRALETSDIDALLERFAPFPILHVIDLDAAKGRGENRALVERIARKARVRVGGGVRTAAQAARLIEAGAHQVILGSAAFSGESVDESVLSGFSSALGAERLLAAVDFKGGRVAIDAWRRTLPITPFEALRQMEPYVDGFLCTCVDKEGLLAGTDIPYFLALRRSTQRRLVAAGGISTRQEVERLVENGIEVALGMALYTGTLDLPTLLSFVEGKLPGGTRPQSPSASPLPEG